MRGIRFLVFVSGLLVAAAVYSDNKTAIGQPVSIEGTKELVRGRSAEERRVKINIPVSYKKCPAGDESPATASGDFEKEVLRLVNLERQKLGLKALESDPDLTRSARYHANDMAVEDYFDHDSKDRENGRLVHACRTFERIGKFARNGSAENIAAGQQDPRSVMTSWMNSPGHKANILSKGARSLGVGVAKGQKGYGIYWVQNFGY